MKATDSAFWKAIVRIWPHITQHQFWFVGEGNNINAWTDNWIART